MLIQLRIGSDKLKLYNCSHAIDRHFSSYACFRVPGFISVVVQQTRGGGVDPGPPPTWQKTSRSAQRCVAAWPAVEAPELEILWIRVKSMSTFFESPEFAKTIDVCVISAIQEFCRKLHSLAVSRQWHEILVSMRAEQRMG